MLSGHLVLTALDRLDNVALVLAAADPARPPIMAEANEAFLRVTGLARDTIAGAPLDILIRQGTDGAAWNRLSAAIAKGEALRDEILLANAAGQPFWFGFALTHVRDPLSGRSHPVLTGRDITQQRRIRQEEASMQALLGSIYMKVDAAVALVRASGHLMLVNPAFQQLTGFSAEELIGRHVRDLTAPEEVEDAARAHARQLADGRPYRMALHVLRKGGGTAPVRLTSVLVERTSLERFRVVTLHPEETAAARPAAPAAPPPLPAAPAPAAPPTPATVGVGRVETLSLEAIRAAYAEEWEKVSGRLLMLAEAIIKRRLHPGDVFARTNGQGFCIWFAGGTEEEQAQRMASLAREIRIRLLGEFGESPAASVTAIAVQVEADPAADPGAPPDAASLPALERKLREKVRSIEEQARHLVTAIAARPPTEILRVTDRTGAPAGLAWADLPRAEEIKLDAALASLPDEDLPGADPDILRLRMTLEALAADLAQGRPGNWLLPVSCRLLLQRRRREPYLEQLRGLPSGTRQRLIGLLSDIPSGMPQPRLRDCLNLIAPLLHGIGLLSRAPELPFEALLRAPCAMVAIDLESGDPPAEDAAFAVIGKARQHQLPVLVRVASAEQTHSWRELGATLFAVAAPAVARAA